MYIEVHLHCFCLLDQFPVSLLALPALLEYDHLSSLGSSNSDFVLFWVIDEE